MHFTVLSIMFRGQSEEIKVNIIQCNVHIYSVICYVQKEGNTFQTPVVRTCAKIKVLKNNY